MPRPSLASRRYEELKQEEFMLRASILTEVLKIIDNNGSIRLPNEYIIQRDNILTDKNEMISWDEVTASQALEIYAAIVKTLNN